MKIAGLVGIAHVIQGIQVMAAQSGLIQWITLPQNVAVLVI
jgi:hypothetical protein